MLHQNHLPERCKNVEFVGFMGASIHPMLETPSIGAGQAYWED